MKTVKTRVIAAVSAMLVTVSAVSFPLAVLRRRHSRQLPRLHQKNMQMQQR